MGGPTVVALNRHGEMDTLHSTVAVHSYIGLILEFVGKSDAWRTIVNLLSKIFVH